METLTERTFDQINRNAQPYPAYLLPEHGTGLALFAAGFHGWNDVIHMARKEMTITCVDKDAEKLWEMATLYPEPCEYVVEDAWTFAHDAITAGRTWDVVSVDPFMGGAAEMARQSLADWCQLAEKFVTFTVAIDRPLWAPPGWTADLYTRNTRVGWMVPLAVTSSVRLPRATACVV